LNIWTFLMERTLPDTGRASKSARLPLCPVNEWQNPADGRQKMADERQAGHGNLELTI
jgi:hypothetical protein